MTFKTAPRRPAKQSTYCARPRPVARCTVALPMAEPVRKFEYVRSPALMKAYRLIPCQSCGADDGTVVGAHSNHACHGKGRSIKASDIYCASLCHKCHHDVDQSSWSGRQERKAKWLLAHQRTVQELLMRGLWPDGVMAPDVSKTPEGWFA